MSKKAKETSCELSNKPCVPCEGGIPPLTHQEITKFMRELSRNWKVIENHHLEKEYHFPDFQKALDFTVEVGKTAEAEGHHPDIHLSWGKVKVTIWTHKINGLTESDFILAAKLDKIAH